MTVNEITLGVLLVAVSVCCIIMLLRAIKYRDRIFFLQQDNSALQRSNHSLHQANERLDFIISCPPKYKKGQQIAGRFQITGMPTLRFGMNSYAYRHICSLQGNIPERTCWNYMVFDLKENCMLAAWEHSLADIEKDPAASPQVYGNMLFPAKKTDAI